jgi:hypothetical protein
MWIVESAGSIRLQRPSGFTRDDALVAELIYRLGQVSAH